MVLRPTLDQQVTFLYTADLEQTAVFYREVLQLPLVLDQGACQIFGVTRQAFVGFCRHLEAPAQPQGVILTLVSDQVDAWHDFLRANGVAIEKPPTYNARFNIYHLLLRDPNGYLIEVQQFLDPAWPSARRGHDI